MFGWLLGIVSFALSGYTLDTLTEYTNTVVGLGIGTGIMCFTVGTLMEIKENF